MDNAEASFWTATQMENEGTKLVAFYKVVKQTKKHKCQYNSEVECVATDIPQICPRCHIFQEWSIKIMEMN
jgi:hypothetical protein